MLKLQADVPCDDDFTRNRHIHIIDHLVKSNYGLHTCNICTSYRNTIGIKYSARACVYSMNGDEG